MGFGRPFQEGAHGYVARGEGVDGDATQVLAISSAGLLVHRYIRLLDPIVKAISLSSAWSPIFQHCRTHVMRLDELVQGCPEKASDGTPTIAKDDYPQQDL